MKIITKRNHRARLKLATALLMFLATGCGNQTAQNINQDALNILGLECYSSFNRLSRTAAQNLNASFASEIRPNVRSNRPLRIFFDSEGFQEAMTNQFVFTLKQTIKRNIALLSRKDIDAVQRERQLKRQGTVDRGTLGLAAKIAGADYQLTGSAGVNQLDQRFTVSFRLTDLETSGLVWTWAGCLRNQATDKLVQAAAEKKKTPQGPTAYLSFSAGSAFSSDILIETEDPEADSEEDNVGNRGNRGNVDGPITGTIDGFTLREGEEITIPFDTGYYIGGTIGSSFLDQFLRLEIEATYSAFEGKEIIVNIIDASIARESNPTVVLRNGTNPVDTELTEATISTNMYIAFGPASLKPYFGLGLGVSFWELSSAPLNISRTAFLFPLMLGVDYQLTNNIFISAEYRFEVNTSGADAGIGDLLLLHHNLLGKIRWEY